MMLLEIKIKKILKRMFKIFIKLVKSKFKLIQFAIKINLFKLHNQSKTRKYKIEVNNQIKFKWIYKNQCR